MWLARWSYVIDKVCAFLYDLPGISIHNKYVHVYCFYMVLFIYVNTNYFIVIHMMKWSGMENMFTNTVSRQCVINKYIYEL